MSNKPQANPGMYCPLYRKDVSKVCHTCEWYILVRGKDPQSMKEYDNWGCAMRWLPIMAIENSQMQRQTAAAVESFRNETVKRQDQVINTIIQEAERNSHNAIGSDNTKLIGNS